MKYEVRHQTVYEYARACAYSHCSLRLSPTTEPGQIVLDHNLSVEPAPVSTSQHSCFFGNTVTSVTIETPHQELRLDARSTLLVERAPPPDPLSTQEWEQVREEGFSIRSLAPDSPAHFLPPSRYAPRFEPATAYSRMSFTPKRRVLDAAQELMRRIRADFRYDAKATSISTPLAQAFEQRRGVCQDFAHIMIAALRGVGLPARYISGYLRTVPPPGKQRLEGADASHAWTSIWCGEAHGWIGLDPTNALMIGNDHIVLARGRDYADISPVSGIVLGSGEQDVEVMVDVIPVAETQV